MHARAKAVSKAALSKGCGTVLARSRTTGHESQRRRNIEESGAQTNDLKNAASPSSSARSGSGNIAISSRLNGWVKTSLYMQRCEVVSETSMVPAAPLLKMGYAAGVQLTAVICQG